MTTAKKETQHSCNCFIHKIIKNTPALDLYYFALVMLRVEKYYWNFVEK